MCDVGDEISFDRTSKVKASDFHNPMPPDWDPIGAPKGADQSVICRLQRRGCSKRKWTAAWHLATLLNVGIRAGTKVPRVLNPKSNELIEYNVFRPKVLAGIGTLPDTVASRSIPIRLERRTRDQKLERFRPRCVEPVGVALTASSPIGMRPISSKPRAL